MISEKVYKLCHEAETVSSEMAKDPSLAPGDIYQRLYARHDQSQVANKESQNGKEITQEDLERAAQCGNWGPTKPSATFLRVCPTRTMNFWL